MISEKIILLFLFPLIFLIGKIITKNTEEEIKEIRNTTMNITKIIILLLTYLTLITKISQIATITISIMLLIYLIQNKQSPKEKVIIAIMTSLAILNLHIPLILLGVIATLLKGLNTQEIGEKILTKHTTIQVTLFFLMISFKFVVIGIAQHFIA